MLIAVLNHMMNFYTSIEIKKRCAFYYGLNNEEINSIEESA